MTKIITPAGTTPVALPIEDRSYNAAIDHGAVAGAYAHIAAIKAASGLKKTATTTTNYGLGFGRGFMAGWRSAK